jgi:dTDP-4-dehydrorhamnose 3,5-epimerase
MPSHERGIAFDDPALGIDWQVKVDNFILSEKDTKNPLLADAEVFDYTAKEYLQ